VCIHFFVPLCISHVLTDMSIWKHRCSIKCLI